MFDKAPLYLRETLLFPYTQGMVFQHAVFDKEGQAAFASVFTPAARQHAADPPPGEVFRRRKTRRPSAAEPWRAQGEYRILAEGTVGELDHSILLRQYADQPAAELMAPRWRGGNYRLLEHKKDGRTVLAYATEWADAAAAKQFFGLYRKVLRREVEDLEVTSESETRLAGRGDDGYFILRLERRPGDQPGGPAVTGRSQGAPAVNCIWRTKNCCAACLQLWLA